MRVPINWLKDFVQIKYSPQKLAEKLTLYSLQVDKIDGDVLEVEITPNRGDCLSILGIAREIAAIGNLKLKTKKSKLSPQMRDPAAAGHLKTGNLRKPLDVQILDKKICPRYTYRIIDGIRIKPSPKWIQERLKAYGLRPINNIVDITNYVMIELGQPLHAFDYDKISGCQMIVRRAKVGESAKTLDDKIRILDSNAIVISDCKKLIDLAGIMGGQNSQVSNTTKTVVLQAAIFDPVLIRKTSKKLNLQTEASYRYERQVDFEETTLAIERATSLILDSCNGQAGEIVDIKNTKWQNVKIKWQPEQDFEKILGIKIKKEKIFQILEKLGIKCLSCSFDGKTCQMEIPSFRHDLKIASDLVEEVARLYGYWNLPKKILSKHPPASRPSSTRSGETEKGLENRTWQAVQVIKDIFCVYGFTEVESYPYVSLQDLEKAKLEPSECLEIQNPISSETQFMRPNLFVSILKQIAKNPWAPEIKMFEVGSIFDKNSERQKLIIVCDKPVVFLQKIWDEMFSGKKPPAKYEAREVGKVILDKFKIRRRQVSYIEVELEDLVEIFSQIKKTFYKIPEISVKYRPISKFPPAVFDLAFVVPSSCDSGQVALEIKKISDKILLVELFDEFYFPKKDRKNIAFHIWLQSLEKTLKEKEVNEIANLIVKNIQAKFEAKLRNY